jgi:DNA (cytosine-5)-methyltransferase 1
MLAVVERERPAWIIGENVIDLDGMALAQVVSDLEGIGYAVAPPFEIPACAVGHDHRRSRLWICGHANREGKSKLPIDAEVAGMSRCGSDTGRAGAPDGLPRRLDRIKALGNAVVPQIPELIGRAIMNVERPYDSDDDITNSVIEAYRAIKARKAAGGKGWPP